MLHLRNIAFLPASEPPRGLELSPPRTAKRRVFTAAQKARIVEESFVSGDSVCAVARRHGLMAAQLFAWRKSERLRREEGRFDESRAAPITLFAQDFEVDLPPRRDTAPIEISIGAVTVRVSQGFDAQTLTAVLQAIQNAS